MAATGVETPANFALHDDGSVEFFGCRGAVENGVLKITRPLIIRAEVNKPANLMGSVCARLARVVESGEGDRIAQLQLSPDQAVVFFHEGGITAEHLQGRIEDPGVVVDIPDVEIDGHMLTVRVFNGVECRVDIADSEGTVL